MDDDRLNSPSTSVILSELFGHRLEISQDLNSRHLGTTVWDASMVFAKYLERNIRKGKFSASKLKGKCAIVLGAGCGLSGFGMALLGCDVVSTDQVEVLSLLMRNVEQNISWISQANPDTASIGSILVAELDWGNKDHINVLEPPFDYIIGTDVVYAEHLLDPLLQTIIALSGPKTTILMDCKYPHHSIRLFLMEQKLQPKSEENNSNLLQVSENKNEMEDNEDVESEKSTSEGIVRENGNVDDWETRRCGAIAARLLKDVKIT